MANALGFSSDPSLFGQVPVNFAPMRRPYRSHDVFHQSDDHYLSEAYVTPTPTGDHGRSLSEMMPVHSMIGQFGG